VAEPSAPLLLSLDLTAAHRHLVGVRLVWQPRGGEVLVRLPAWTPGSYVVRDYVRTLEGFEAWQGERPLPHRRVAPAAWALSTAADAPVELRYRILATERSVRTCHVDADHAFLALAGVALLPEGERWSPQRLELRLPDGWRAFVPLAEEEAGGWRARDYDQLIDSPVEAGPHAAHGFRVAGVPHRWVTAGGDLPGEDPAWLADVERVCLACCRLMGRDSLPWDEPYLFVLHLLEDGYGGLEHDRATVLQYGRRALARPGGRRKLLQLVAHEYLHRWNVRRLRPAELVPIDYDAPMLVPSLWFAEGITSYYDALLPLAAGIGGEEELLEDLGGDLSRYLLTPGRRVQSLRDSSLEAWVKLYRQDAHSGDSQVSYYLKGAVVALLLDLHLRRHGSALAVVLRDLWRRFGDSGRGYREVDLLEAFAAAAADLAGLLPNWLESNEDPDISGYLQDVGLMLVPQHSPLPSMGWQVESLPRGGLRLRRVRRDGPAERAGLQPGDELLALEAQRLGDEEDLHRLLGSGAVESLELLYARDGWVRAVEVAPDPPEIESWSLRIDPAAPPEAAGRRARWLALEP
jgi:predicted metalloprotease with PDZ domain